MQNDLLTCPNITKADISPHIDRLSTMIPILLNRNNMNHILMQDIPIQISIDGIIVSGRVGSITYPGREENRILYIVQA